MEWVIAASSIDINIAFGSLCCVIGAAVGVGEGWEEGMGRRPRWLARSIVEKQKAVKGSQLESNKKAMTVQCKVCMQTFICTTSELKCREHAEAKHPKADLYTCFPHLKK